MGTKSRILFSQKIDGKNYQTNQVVDLPAAQAKALANEGAIDVNKGAVAYCVEQLGAEVILHNCADAPTDSALVA